MEMLTIPGQQTVFNGVRVAQLFVFSVVICRSVCRCSEKFVDAKGVIRSSKSKRTGKK
jgi:hypothetical protein